MGIKRPLMILGSTVGAVATVLSYHPVASSSSALSEVVPETPTPPATSVESPTPSSTPTPTPTESKRTKPVKKAQQAEQTKPKQQATGSATSQVPNVQPITEQIIDGQTVQTRWGPVQVQITVKDGMIINATALAYPDGDRRSLMISEQAIPWLVEETLAEQIADVQIIGGATYTSMGWRQSLASAMQKAGL